MPLNRVGPSRRNGMQLAIQPQVSTPCPSRFILPPESSW